MGDTVKENHMNTRENCKRMGFTLIELLVVVAVLTILVGLLLAALGHARHHARAAACLSNQHQTSLDASNYATDRGLFPWLTTGGNWFHEQILLCPADARPVRMPSQAMGTLYDVPVSYGFNPEYAFLKVPSDRVPLPSQRLLLYDGFGATGGAGGGGGGKKGGTTGPDYFIDGNKITITHLPPGNNANPQVASIGLSAFAAHVGHNNPDATHVDLPGDWVVNGRIDIPTYTQGDFLRRHPVGDRIGHAAFLDGHAVATQFLDPSWYLFPN